MSLIINHAINISSITKGVFPQLNEIQDSRRRETSQIHLSQSVPLRLSVIIRNLCDPRAFENIRWLCQKLNNETYKNSNEFLRLKTPQSLSLSLVWASHFLKTFSTVSIGLLYISYVCKEYIVVDCYQTIIVQSHFNHHYIIND